MFVVIEIQNNGETSTVFTYSFNSRNEADSKYYSILAEAAVSKVEIHSAILLTVEGYYITSACFKHQTTLNTETE